MTRIAVVPQLDAATYRRHVLHADDRVWVEKNCYVDIWIEVLHALGLDPIAILPFAIAIDFEDDQWTFFKPPHVDLWDLYGVDVQELTVWRPLIDHAVTQLSAGKLISTEADAFFLPDTQGTDYKTQHTKTTVVLHKIDVEARRRIRLSCLCTPSGSASTARGRWMAPRCGRDRGNCWRGRCGCGRR